MTPQEEANLIVSTICRVGALPPEKREELFAAHPEVRRLFNYEPPRRQKIVQADKLKLIDMVRAVTAITAGVPEADRPWFFDVFMDSLGEAVGKGRWAVRFRTDDRFEERKAMIEGLGFETVGVDGELIVTWGDPDDPAHLVTVTQ